MEIRQLKYLIDGVTARAIYNYTVPQKITFTTDLNSVEIVFELQGVDITGSTAKIGIQTEDKSYFELTGTIVGTNTVKATIPENVANHGGLAYAQLMVTSSGKVYTYEKVIFKIEQSIGDQVLFEMVIPEITTKVAEMDKAILAEQDRVSAENTRIANENTRITNEQGRVTAESARVQADAKRTADLAFKADKLLATNLLDDGDFSSGTISGWSGQGAIRSYENGQIKAVGNGTNIYIAVSKVITGGMIKDHKYYIRFKATVDSNTQYLKTYNGVSVEDLFVNPTGTNTVSKIVTCLDVTPFLVIYAYYADRFAQNGKTLFLDDILVIDLTATYGAGNEPTKETMDRLLSEFPNKFFNGTVELYNLKNLPKFLDDKASKVQEAWITPTLLNGATGDLQFRKTQFNELEFKGSITMPSPSLSFMTLPTTHKPSVTTYRATASSDFTLAVATINSSGSVLVQNSKKQYFDGITIPLT